jgi:MFS family permease
MPVTDHRFRRRGAYYGFLGLVWAIANASGPFLGGIFAEKLDWRWCFWLNVPLDLAAFVLTAFFLKVHTPHTPFWEGIKAIDWLGSLAVVGGTVMLLLGLEFGGIDYPWSSPIVVVLILCGFMTWVGFFFIEAYVPKYPLIPLRIFDSVSKYAIFAIDFSHGFVFIAGSYFLPVYFQAVLGAKPLLSGIYLFPFVITLAFSAVATGFIINRTGAYRLLIGFGMLFMTLGFALFTDLPSHASWGRIVVYQIIAGLGIGPNFQSPMLALQNSVAPHDIAPATSTFGFVRQLANSISVVIGGVLLQHQLKDRRPALVEAGIEARVVDLITGGSASSSTMEIHTLPPAQRRVAQQAFADSMQKMWLMYACVGIVGLGLTDFVTKRALRKDHVETKTGLPEQERIRQDAIRQKAAQQAQRRIATLLPPVSAQSDPPWEKTPPRVDVSEISGKSAEVLGFNSPTVGRSPMSSITGDDSQHSSARNPSVAGTWNAPAYMNSDSSSNAASMYFTPAPTGEDSGSGLRATSEGALRAARRRAEQRGTMAATTRPTDGRGNWFDELNEVDTSEAQDGSHHGYWPDIAYYSPENGSVKAEETDETDADANDRKGSMEIEEMSLKESSGKAVEAGRLSPLSYNAWMPNSGADGVGRRRDVI